MSYRVRPSETIQANVRRIARGRIDDALDALDRALAGGDLHRGVHEARRRAKQARAVTRLVRTGAPDAHETTNPLLRDAGRRMSALRDTDAMLETLDIVGADEDLDGVATAVAAVRDVLMADRDVAAGDAHDDIADARRLLAQARDAVADWAVPDDPDVLAAGVAKTYGRARDDLVDVRDDPSTERLHDWRKRAKYHRYHVRLLVPTWKPVLAAREMQLHRHTNLLGHDHDLAVLRGTLADHDTLDPVAVRTLAAIVDRRRGELQQAALPLGARLFAAPPDAIAALVVACWQAWQSEANSHPIPVAGALAPSG